MRKKYIAFSEEAGKCPYCGNTDVIYGHEQIEDNNVYAYYEVICKNCKRTWREWYYVDGKEYFIKTGEEK